MKAAGSQLLPRDLTIQRHSSSSTSNSTEALRTILNDAHYAIINDERNLLADLHAALVALEVPSTELDLVADTRARIDDLYMILVVGEFNAGKSTFINSLLGAEYLLSGVLPTTDKICLLRIQNSDAPVDGGAAAKAANESSAVWNSQSENFLLDDVEERLVPSEWLRNVALVDTPGTNALLSRHSELTQHIIPRADLVLFLTSAERPMSESESHFLERIATWGKKIIVVVNKMDVLHTEADRAQVLDYVRSHISTRLKRVGGQPVPLFPVSSKKALQAKLRLDQGDAEGLKNSLEWVASGTGELEAHLKSVLGSDALVASKLNNPLLVCDRLVSAHLQTLNARKEALVADVRTVELLKENMAAFEQDVQRDVKFSQSQLQAMFIKHKASVALCVDEHVTLSNLPSLLNMGLFEEELRTHAKLELKGMLEDTIVDISGLVATRSRAQAAAVVQYVGARHKANARARDFVGAAGAVLSAAPSEQFDKNSRELKQRLQRECAAVFEKTASGNEAGVRDAILSVRNAYLQVIGSTGMSMMGLAAVAMDAVDWPLGVAMFAAPFGLSAFTMPSTRKAIKQKFAARADSLQRELDEGLTQTLMRQLRTISENIQSSIFPYERFVSHETRTTNEMKTRMEQLRQSARDLRSRLESGS